MKEIVVSLDGDAYDSLEEAADRNGRTIEVEAATRLIASLAAGTAPPYNDGAETMAGGETSIDEKTLIRYVKRRLKGEEPVQIATQLGCEEARLQRFDAFIRETRAQWNRIYFKVRESFDPLTWEMKYMDKFHEFWGEEP